MLDITDGTSNTAMFSEHLRGGRLGANPDGTNVIFVIPNQATLDSTFGVCQSVNPATGLLMCLDMGECWAMGEDCCTQYNHVSTPNTKFCAGFPFPGSMTNMAMCSPPSSAHTTSVNVLTCDGSVHQVSNGISLPTWRALGTRNGGDVLFSDF